MPYGIVIYEIYYFYNKDTEPEENNISDISEETPNELSNIRLGIANFDSLNPLISKNQNIQDISKLIYEPLFNISDDFKLKQSLAIEFSKVDNVTYFIKLRENVKWHNGSDFSAEDVKYTIETIKALGDNSIYHSNVSNINNVEIISNNLVKIFLNEEKPFYEYNLTFPIISSSFFGEGDITNSDKNNIPMGTGKYKIQTTEVNSQMELKTNKDWWNTNETNLRIDTITVRIYGTIAELYNGYKLGGIDLIASQSLNVEDNIGTIGSNVQKNFGRNFDYLALNCQSNMLSHKEVRQAISYCLNKEEIVNTVYGGKYIVADHPLAYGSYLYNKNTSNDEYNIDKAKQTLELNEWTFSYGSWQKKIGYNTVKLRINLVVQSTNENRVKVAEIIKKNLEEIGISVTIISVKDATYENYLKNKNYDILLTGVTVGVSPDMTRYFGDGNFANYNNNEVSEIQKELYSISDEKTIKEKYEKLQSIYESDRPYIGLYFNRNMLIFNKNVSTTTNNNWFNIFSNIENWHRKN